MDSVGMTDQELKENVMDLKEVNAQLYQELLSFFPMLFLLKSYAFREECEHRLLSHLVIDGEDDCSHRVVDNRIVPYRKVEFAELDCGPIAEIILGPKHGTPPKIVENFMKLNHYGRVKVTRSEASYR